MGKEEVLNYYNDYRVIWGIESVCHAENKIEFLKESKRLLRKGGRIILADGFAGEENLSTKSQEQLNKFLRGWAVPNLASFSNLKDYLKENGFGNFLFKDITENVMRSSIRLYKASIITWPIAKFMELLKIRSKAEAGNLASARLQHITLKKQLWKYGIFYCKKLD